jgi:hypothetical protein
VKTPQVPLLKPGPGADILVKIDKRLSIDKIIVGKNILFKFQGVFLSLLCIYCGHEKLLPLLLKRSRT